MNRIIIKRIGILLFWISMLAPDVKALEFTVNTTDDTIDVNVTDGLCMDINGNCSLRAAIMQTNTFATEDLIYLPRNEVYPLTLSSIGADNERVNDLDIRGTLMLSIADPEIPVTTLEEMPVIYGNLDLNDRVFEIQQGLNITFFGVVVSGGNADASAVNTRRGGGIYVASGVDQFSLIQSVVAYNQAGFGAGLYSEADNTLIESSDISYNILNIPTLITSGAAGAGIYHDGLEITISKSSIHHNYVDTFGFFPSALAFYGDDSQVRVLNSLVGENGLYPSNGDRTVSGIRAKQAHVTINNSNISNNGGTGIEFDSDAGHTLVIRNSVLVNNQLDNCGDLEGDINLGSLASLGKIMSTDDSCNLPSSAGNSESLNSGLLSVIQGRFETESSQFFSFQYPLIDDTSILIDGGSSLDVNSDEISACETEDFYGTSRPIYGFYANQCDVGMIESNDLIYRNGFDST